MNSIKINRDEINDRIDKNEKNIHDFIYKVNDEKFPGNIVTSITFNGKLMSEQELHLLDVNVSDISELVIESKSSLELVFEAIESCGKYIDVIIENIQKLTVSYQENRLNEADIKFSETIEILDLFIQLMSRIYKNLKDNKNISFDKAPSIQQLEVHLLSILKGLVPAKEKKDIIMLCDLLEYELIDNLKQWKVSVIPSLKKIKENHSWPATQASNPLI